MDIILQVQLARIANKLKRCWCIKVKYEFIQNKLQGVISFLQFEIIDGRVICLYRCSTGPAQALGCDRPAFLKQMSAASNPSR